ncbi:MAG: endonuclease [Muribaculaceae bacterium]|nr:endonuclease [Muribaculaceae bacterium]
MKKFLHGFLPLIIALTGLFQVSAKAPVDFYKSAEGKSQKALLTALNAIVGPHTAVSYKGLWTVYLTSDVRADKYVWDMYSTANFVPGQKQCGNYTQVGDCYNREHSFPKSWFNDATPMYSDAYHIYPTDGKVNGQRSNYPYGECENGTTLSPNGNIKALGKLGACTFPGYSGTVFEPVDEYKGDFARTYFYMASAYQDKIGGWNSPMLSHDSYPCYASWALNLLLKWHREDPVSEKEINRNEVVYGYQKNRNPYIDYPELAEYVWGNKKNEGWVPGGVVDPVIYTPVADQKVDMGITSISKPIAHNILVKGTALTQDLNVSISDSHFVVANSTLAKDAVNSTSGANLALTYTSATAGSHSAVLTISSAEVSVKVNLEAVTYDGIPALKATNVSTDRFDANWLDVSGGNYTLNVFTADGVTQISGYPVQVAASLQSSTITGLQPGTDYSYSLTNGTISSNVVKVRTADPVPVLTLIYPESGLNFNSLPGEVAEPIDIEVYTEYVTEQITATITGEFEASLDKQNWSSSVSINAEGEHFYIRSKKIDKEGVYFGSVALSTPTLTGEDADLKATVAAPRSFFEDFETVKQGGYYNSIMDGRACKWDFKEVGVWDDPRRNDALAARFGKATDSSLAMAEDKLNGAGTFSFYAALFGTDVDAKVNVMYSVDGGQNWTLLSEVAITETILTQHSVPANINGQVRFKIVKTEGKRFNIDDISISDYSSVASINSDKWDVYPTADGVVVECADNANVAVYSLDAVKVAGAAVSANKTFIALPSGAYIVAIDDNRGKKIIVK